MRHSAHIAMGSVLSLVIVNCSGGDGEDLGKTSSRSASLVSWAEGTFSQVLRVNTGEMAVRNRCELTITVANPTPLTFIGSNADDSSTESLGWKGNAVTGQALAVTACAGDPCEVTAQWQTSEVSGTAVGCKLIADNGTSRFRGTTTGTAFTLPQAPAVPVIFQQHVNFGPSGTSGACVFRESTGLLNAQFSAFKVHVNGIEKASLDGPIPIGTSGWPTKGPDVAFGTLYVGADLTATRLKHVAAKKEQLAEGDSLRCAGRFLIGSAAAFDVNVNAAPLGNGISLVDETTSGWTCSSTMFGTNDGCQCDCGIVDPDCAIGECPACPTRDVGEVGGPCTSDVECNAVNGLCNTSTSQAGLPEGYCMLDNGGTACAVDADCGTGNVCANINDFGDYKVCLPACTCSGSTCPDHQACMNSLNGTQLDKYACTPGTLGTQDGAACQGSYDCDAYSSCFTGMGYPGGSCTRYDCTVGDDSTCHGGHCVSFVLPPIGTRCVDPCTIDSDCRQAEGYECFDPGSGAQKYCRHPQVGDPCADAADCGGAGWTCLGSTGGYCTVTNCPTPGSTASCPLGSVCYDDPTMAQNYCVTRCLTPGLQAECRIGYQCQDVDPGFATTPGCVSL